MKWGVRRYQNYDGTYTKKGLARFNQASSDYDKANEKLRTAKSNYKSGSGSKSDYKNAKGEAKIAKRKMNQAYDSLKTDKMADEGKNFIKMERQLRVIIRNLLLLKPLQ
jgi:multidrug resistance efflux pump